MECRIALGLSMPGMSKTDCNVFKTSPHRSIHVIHRANARAFELPAAHRLSDGLAQIVQGFAFATTHRLRRRQTGRVAGA
jgi:hypothetical protein